MMLNSQPGGRLAGKATIITGGASGILGLSIVDC